MMPKESAAPGTSGKKPRSALYDQTDSATPASSRESSSSYTEDYEADDELGGVDRVSSAAAQKRRPSVIYTEGYEADDEEEGIAIGEPDEELQGPSGTIEIGVGLQEAYLGESASLVAETHDTSGDESKGKDSDSEDDRGKGNGKRNEDTVNSDVARKQEDEVENEMYID
jgi:hypothetical protein